MHEGRFQRQAGSALQLLGEFAAHRIYNVHFSVFQRRQPRGFVGDDPQCQPFDGGSFAPISVKGLEHQFEAGLERYEFVRPGPDWRLLESLLADLLDMIFRDDPAGPGRRGIECQEIGPRLGKVKADAPRILYLHRGDALPHQLVRGAAVAIEGELDVLDSDRIAIMELRTVAEHEIVGAAHLR